ncbi:hypothetical protein C8J57DRAFT_1463039 [Mycena rebaudengoi]|nr:hypothetical protein C8J57DRAFT_1463039 [Mycena rebaudengoi]
MVFPRLVKVLSLNDVQKTALEVLIKNDYLNKFRTRNLIRGHVSVPIVAVGLKSDLLDEREVDAATIKALSSQWNIPFYEASAKLKWHVDDVFEDLVRQLRRKYPPDPVRILRKRGKRRQGPCIIM